MRRGCAGAGGPEGGAGGERRGRATVLATLCQGTCPGAARALREAVLVLLLTVGRWPWSRPCDSVPSPRLRCGEREAGPGPSSQRAPGWRLPAVGLCRPVRGSHAPSLPAGRFTTTCAANSARSTRTTASSTSSSASGTGPTGERRGVTPAPSPAVPPSPRRCTFWDSPVAPASPRGPFPAFARARGLEGFPLGTTGTT